ncbi:MAG: TlpA family protein disulfide reductase [Acidobacteria bacterium]|nr:TlpA family protein disulfide reductase [Acidobacteriota bacterium]
MILCLLLLAAAAACGSEPQVAEVGAPAPGFTLQSPDGQSVESRSLKGHVVVLNFWATWCQPCMAEIPELKEFAANSPDVRVVGVALDEGGAGVVKPFVAEHGMNYTVLVGDEETFQRFGGGGIPYTVLLDRSQRVVKMYRGAITRQKLEQDIKLIPPGA